MRFAGFHIYRLGLYLYFRTLWKYNQVYVIPGISVELVRGCDSYIDLEIKFLCFGGGIRFIWLKNRKNTFFTLTLALLMLAATSTVTSCEKETSQFYKAMREEVNMFKTTFVSVPEGELIKSNADRFKCCVVTYSIKSNGLVTLTAGGTESNLNALFEFAKQEVEKLNQSGDGQ